MDRIYIILSFVLTFSVVIAEEISTRIQEENPELSENGINPELCPDYPDSQMAYDCQYRITHNPRLCDDRSYKGMCRCTCAEMGNGLKPDDDIVPVILSPDDLLPIVPAEESTEAPVNRIDPERCPDYQGSDMGRGCFLRVVNLKGQTCDERHRRLCPCTCRALDDNELCPDSPWHALSGDCLMKADNGQCSDLKVREECPCTCAFMSTDVPGIYTVESESTESSSEVINGNENNEDVACIDTAGERRCSYYIRNDMCTSWAQYCRRSCGLCSVNETISDHEEPIVNIMPEIDLPDPQDPNEEEAALGSCFDRAPQVVCNLYKVNELCFARWLFCQRTCDVCVHNPYVENSETIELESNNEGQQEEHMIDHHEEEDEDEDEEQVNSELCIDRISPYLCENLYRLNHCDTWWPYCRNSCDVCEENPYQDDTPELPLVDPNQGEGHGGEVLGSCPTCQLFEDHDSCPSIDEHIRVYCQTECLLCLPDGEVVTEWEGESDEVEIDTNEQEDEDDLLPEPCRNAVDGNADCLEWYRQNRCSIPSVRHVCKWSCNECDQLVNQIVERVDNVDNQQDNFDEVELMGNTEMPINPDMEQTDNVGQQQNNEDEIELLANTEMPIDPNMEQIDNVGEQQNNEDEIELLANTEMPIDPNMEQIDNVGEQQNNEDEIELPANTEMPIDTNMEQIDNVGEQQNNEDEIELLANTEMHDMEQIDNMGEQQNNDNTAECADTVDWCESFIFNCQNDWHRDHMATVCAKTCGHC